MRVVVYTDYVYREVEGVVYGDRAFALFLAALSEHCEVTIVGRLDPTSGAAHYRLPERVRFIALPHYKALTRPVSVAGSLARSLRRFWRALGETDVAWLLGPYPHAVAFAVLTRVRRRPLVLGVRQDFPSYVRNRRPGRRWMHISADALELSWRTLARRSPVVAVGTELAHNYEHAPEVLTITVSLISADDVEAGRKASSRPYDGELNVLSVGRIDAEKNPLLLADALALLRDGDPRWRLQVCGEGQLGVALSAKLAELGLAEFAELRGYVPIDDGLLDLYRASHAFLHVSWTEGVPQVLIEAFASGVPVVATSVGGVEDAVGDAALLIEPGDPAAAVAALRRVAADDRLRRRLIDAGLELAARQTLEHETARVAAFISRCAGVPSPGAPARTSSG
ncbi:MAG TPA: glycosyltransferase [Solirubrobacteraceae bacterium]|nr:glycosyltransferase [Solirubrobacteraceae bacterium]